MNYARMVRPILLGVALSILFLAPNLPVPGAARLGFKGSAAAQATFDIDSFYDELDPYGEWVWHQRHGYVWLPIAVSETWRPYTVGHWVYTDEYGWYWDSYEPFAWAVYHYGRWGYEPAYGWFWVPGDTWAPAWVQWRYSDDYVGWAPLGPRRFGYEYGRPVRYDPPVPESWVFVRPRYLTSRQIYFHALPAGELGMAFGTTRDVYRPEFREGGGVYNYGIPHDRWSRLTNQRVVPRRIHRSNEKGGRYGWQRGGDSGLYVYAPGVSKGVAPKRKPRRFSDKPSGKAKAKLKATAKGFPPNGFAPGAGNVPSSGWGAGVRGKPSGPGQHGNRAVPGQGWQGSRGESAVDLYKQLKKEKEGKEKDKAAKEKAAKEKSARLKADKTKAKKDQARLKAAKTKDDAKAKAEAKAKADAKAKAKAEAAKTKAKKEAKKQAKGKDEGKAGAPDKGKFAKGGGLGGPGGGPNGGGDGGKGKGDRAAKCKENPKLPFCDPKQLAAKCKADPGLPFCKGQ